MLAKMGALTDKQFMKHELLDSLIRFLGIENDGSTVQALSQLIYLNKDQLMSGDFRILAPGLINVFNLIFLVIPNDLWLVSEQKLILSDVWHSNV